MVKCLDILLKYPNRRGPHKITFPDAFCEEFLDISDTLRCMSVPDQRMRILLHLDEHHKMCNPQENPRSAAVFMTEAIEAVANVKLQLTVIATYTEPPPIPTEESSCVPVTMMWRQPCKNILN